MKVFKQLNNLMYTLILCSITASARELSATSLVSCAENSQIEPSYFNVIFDPDSGALRYDISLTTELSGYIFADVRVYAYGFEIIKEQINFCNIGWKQFCPMYPGSLEIDSIEYISEDYVNMIPNIAYTFPDIDAFVRLILTNSTGSQVGCIQASFSNGKSVSHVGAKWATAVVAGIGLLASAILSSFGNSSSASRISANAISLFTYFQSVVIIAMTHVQEVPPIAAAWSENLAWSMGLIQVNFMQKIFRWYVQATGGTPTQYLTNSSVSTLIQRSLAYSKRALRHSIPFYPLLEWLVPSVFKSSPEDDYISEYLDYQQQQQQQSSFALEQRDSSDDMYNLRGNEYLKIIRGMERVGLKANIEPTSIVCTGFTFFVLFLYLLVAVFFIFRLITKHSKGTGFFHARERNWNALLKGVLQRYIYIGFPQLLILSLWEFTKNDSAAVIVIAVLFLLLGLGVMGWACYRTLTFGSISVKSHNNAAAILYGDPNVLTRYGFFYTMFNAKKYWFGAIILIHVFIKGLFVALAQKSGKTQALAIFLLDLAYVIYLIREKPYLDKPTNIVNILMAVVMTLNSFFFLFFSGLFHQPGAVSSVMGLIFFFLNAIFSLVLLVLILVYTVMSITSKNPDARFAPAKDDRTSFQKKATAGESIPEGAQELMDLGMVAKDHNSNWANEMYKLKNMVESTDNTATTTDNQDKPLDLTEEEDKTFGSKLVSKLTGKKSLLRRNLSKMSRRSTTKKLGDSNATTVPTTIGTEKEASPATQSSDYNDSQKSAQLGDGEKRRSPGHESFLGSLSLDPVKASKNSHNRTESNTPIMDTFSDVPFKGHSRDFSNVTTGNSYEDLSLYNGNQQETTAAKVVLNDDSGATGGNGVGGNKYNYL